MGDIEPVASVNPESPLVGQVSNQHQNPFKKNQQEHREPPKEPVDTVEIDGIESKPEKPVDSPVKTRENYLDIAA